MADPKTYVRNLDREALISEANGTMSREQVMFYRGVKIEPNTVLGMISTGAQAVAAPVAGAGNVGNGVFSVAPTADAGAAAGAYQIVITEPAAAAGTFEVRRPSGALDGVGNVGAAYNGTINFTLADGATDFSAGDNFTVTVSYAAGSGLWKPLDLAAVDGSNIAKGVMLDGRPALTGADTRRGVVVVRDADFNGKKLVWPAGISGPQKATAIAQLGTANILVRN